MAGKISLFLMVLLLGCGEENTNKISGRVYVDGEEVYQLHCISCHGADGKGEGKLYPPLSDSDYLKKNENQLACIIKNGLRGEIFVNGQSYNLMMPANDRLTDEEVSAVINFITNSWENNYGMNTSVEQVTKQLGKCE